MRATQKKMMSNPVIRTEVGKYFFSSSVSSGQPRVPMGQRPEENQVSRTSGSRQSSIFDPFASPSLSLSTNSSVKKFLSE